MDILNNFLLQISSFFKNTLEFLQNLENGVLISILLLIIFLLLFIHNRKIKKLNYRLDTALNIKVNEKLISDLNKNTQKIFDLEIFIDTAEKDFQKINKQLQLMYKSHTLKYNPFQDMGVGGNQSFSTSFINNYGDGIILTSLYSRDRTRLLLKEIKKYSCEQELSSEEKQVLNKYKK